MSKPTRAILRAPNWQARFTACCPELPPQQITPRGRSRISSLLPPATFSRPGKRRAAVASRVTRRPPKSGSPPAAFHHSQSQP